MAATAVNPFQHQNQNPVAPGDEPSKETKFVQMSDTEQGNPAAYNIHGYAESDEVLLEKRGRRLRRAALITGIIWSVSIMCTIYSTIAVRWVLIDWKQPELTAYAITDSIGVFRVGIACDVVMAILETFVGVLIGMILIGAGVNPAMSVITVVFKMMQTAIMGANVMNLYASAILLDPNISIYKVIQSYFFSEYTQSVGSNLAYLFLVIHKYGTIFAEVFAGVQMLVFGFIILMWGVFPRFLGYTIFLSGPAYFINGLLYLFIAGYDGQLGVLFMIPIIISNFGLAGWLLVNTPHPAKNREILPFMDVRSYWAEAKEANPEDRPAMS